MNENEKQLAQHAFDKNAADFSTQYEKHLDNYVAHVLPEMEKETVASLFDFPIN